MNILDSVYAVGVDHYFEKKALFSGSVAKAMGAGAEHSTPLWHSIADVAGLGTLATIPASEIAGKKWGPTEESDKKRKAVADIAGLGGITAGPAHTIWQHYHPKPEVAKVPGRAQRLWKAMGRARL